MKMEEYRNKLQERIDELNEYLKSIPEDDHCERAIVYGQINAYLNAKLLTY